MNHNGLQTDAQRQVQPDFRAATMTIDNHLYDEDVDSMKFLCHGLVVASKLKRIQEAHELIDLLQSANHVTEENYSLLADLLQYIGRIDVLQKIGSDEMEVMVRRHNQGSKINPFYVLLFKIAEELPDEDVKKAMYMYGKVPKSQKVLSGIDLFTVMVQHQAVRPDNVSLLTTIFGSIERQDIVELINRYTGKSWWDLLQFSLFFSCLCMLVRMFFLFSYQSLEFVVETSRGFSQKWKLKIAGQNIFHGRKIDKHRYIFFYEN